MYEHKVTGTYMFTYMDVWTMHTHTPTHTQITQNPKFHNNLTPLNETRTVGYLLLQVPINGTARWAASPVDTRPLGPHG